MKDGAFAATLQADTPPDEAANGFGKSAPANGDASGREKSPEELRMSPAEVYQESHGQDSIKHSPSSVTISKLLNKEDKTVAESRFKQVEDEKAWTQSNTFHCIIGVIVVANAISMGIEVDYGEGREETFKILENFWTFVFVSELVLRLRAEGWKRYFREVINMFDCLLVVMSVLDCWLLSPSGAETDLRSLSMLRIVRLARICKLLRLLRVFRELTIIVSSCMSAMAALFWSSAFLLIIVYISAIFTTIFFGRAKKEHSDCEEVDVFARLLRARSSSADGDGAGANAADECDVYDSFQPDIGSQKTLFGTVDRSMLTLYICLIEGCGIDIIKPMTEIKPVTCVFWIIFIFLTAFGILNLMIGLFCEKVASVSQEQESLMAMTFEQRRQMWLNRLNEMWHDIDADHSGTIKREEFYEALCSSETVMKCIEDLGLQHQAGLFDILDIDGTGGINHQEFFEGMLMIARGQEPAKAKDIVSTYLSCQAIKELLVNIQKQMTEGFVSLKQAGFPATVSHHANGQSTRMGMGTTGSFDQASLARLEALEARLDDHLDRNRLKDLELRLERRVAAHVQGMEERLSARIKQCVSTPASTEVADLQERLAVAEAAIAKLQQNSTRQLDMHRSQPAASSGPGSSSAALEVSGRSSAAGISSAAPVFALGSSLKVSDRK